MSAVSSRNVIASAIWFQVLLFATCLGAAEAILRDGFRDSTGGYGFAELELTGIWLGDSPMTANEGAKGGQVLAVEVDEDLLADYEVIEDGKPYREWARRPSWSTATPSSCCSRRTN